MSTKEAGFADLFGKFNLKKIVSEGVDTGIRQGLSGPELQKAIADGVRTFSQTAKSEAGRHAKDALKQVMPGAIAGATAGALVAPEGDRTSGAARGLIAGAVGGAVARAVAPGKVPSMIGGGAAGALFGSKKEKPMKNKYAGVTLDWYDDKGATLKSKFPTAAALPGVIKEANVRPKESLAHEDFALVAVDEGNVLRKFACHDPGTTAMSVIYFMEHADKLPEGAVKMAASNLVEACGKFGLTPPAGMVKAALLDQVVGYMLGSPEGERMAAAGEKRPKGIRAMDVAGGLFIPGYIGYQAGQRLTYDQAMLAKAKKESKKSKKKTAGVVDITGQRPTTQVKVAAPASDDDYAVVMPDGSRYYPINSWDLVKRAEVYFCEEGLRMQPEIRRQFATKLAAKSYSIGYPLAPDIFEAGSDSYAASGHLKAAVEMRKIACAPGQGREFLDDLFEKRAGIEPEVYAECLRRFDVDQGLDRGWNRVVLDPWASTFGIDKTAAVVWDQGGERVTDAALHTLAQNQSEAIKLQFTEQFLDEFQKDPVTLFNSMPDPQKKVLARMAMDAVSQGGSEVGPTNASKQELEGHRKAL